MTANDDIKERMDRVRALMRQRSYDAVVLRNNYDIRWLTGATRVFDFEDAHTAVITQEGAWLHTDSRYYGSFMERMGSDSGWKVDMELTGHTRWTAMLLRDLHVRCAAIEDTLTLGFYESLVHELNQCSFDCIMPRMHSDLVQMRATKTEEELRLLKRAQEITDAAFDHICGFVRPGQTELQIRAELEGFMLSNGAHALSFDSIVASGPNGANPHARPSERKVCAGDYIVLDYGALYEDYHADMTRTICVGEPSSKQREVYDVVRAAHEAAAAAARPGMLGKDLHEVAAKVISDAGYGNYFKHGLGHGVGLEIHELPSVGRLGEKELEVGSVFTIEPGIYLPGEFGIRLEDCGVMTQDGYAPFTASTHDLVVV